MTGRGPAVTVTRINNSCVLLDFGDDVVLTDPWFTERWHIHRDEPLGMALADLPPLSAIVVSHSFVNHWDRRALRDYRHKRKTVVVVPTERMARQARLIGFDHVEVMAWGDERMISGGLRLEAVEAQRTPGGRNNNYVLETDRVRVFFGGEAEATEPVRRYGATHQGVDLVLLPVNGLSVPLKGRIVMGPARAVASARAVGATVFVPIHDAHANDLLWRFIRRTGSAADADRMTRTSPGGPRVVDLPTGSPWSFDPEAATAR